MIYIYLLKREASFIYYFPLHIFYLSRLSMEIRAEQMQRLHVSKIAFLKESVVFDRL